MLFLFTNSSGPTAKRKNLFRVAYENITNNTKLRFYARSMQNFEQGHKTNKISNENLYMTTFLKVENGQKSEIWRQNRKMNNF